MSIRIDRETGLITLHTPPHQLSDVGPTARVWSTICITAPPSAAATCAAWSFIPTAAFPPSPPGWTASGTIPWTPSARNTPAAA